MKKRIDKSQLWAALTLLLLAASVWFGLPPYYRFVALGLGGLALPTLLWRKGAFWIVLLSLVGCGVFLLSFREEFCCCLLFSLCRVILRDG